jgi:acyl phosphate:glycerol-3-phosphate acyltransferase
VNSYLVVAVACYLIGSFPTAYFVVKFTSHKDIRYVGSGNVGGFNAYEVTRSKIVGTSVIFVDVVKGLAAILIARFFFNPNPTMTSLAFCSVVIGHGYPIWLKFHGGRGLATSAGAMVLISWTFVVMWMLVWLLTGLVSKNIHVRNASAIIICPVIVSMVPRPFLQKFVTAQSGWNSSQFIALSFIVCGLLLLRHLRPLRELTAAQKEIDIHNNRT